MLRLAFCIATGIAVSFGLLQTTAYANIPNATPANANTTPNLSAEKNLSMGRAFLERNKKQADIRTLPSGLQYKVVKEGSGTPPGPTDFVTVNYRGTLLEGTEFDSSYARNVPTTLAVNAVIPGWSEALQLMPPGSKWTLYVPPHLAYGKDGAGKLIGPNATLIFDIELIAVKPSLDESPEGAPAVEGMEEEG